MIDKSGNLSTTEMWRRLFRASDVSEFISGSDDLQALPVFSDYISQLCRARGEKPERVLKRADIESSYGHRLFSGGRRPSRDTVLQLAFGLELNSDEAQQLLKVAREAALHPKIKRDAVIAYCLHRRISLEKTQQLLIENGLPILGGAKNGTI